MQLNQWHHGVKESATLAINQKVKQLREQDKVVSHFGFGESPFPVHSRIQIALSENKHQKAYLPGLGLLPLRQAISQFQNHYFATDFKAKDIAVGPGSKELIFQTLSLLVGDVLIPTPAWVSYMPQAQLLNKTVIAIETSRQTHYKINKDNLSVALKKSTSGQRILILNSPSNPTGQIYSPQELKALADLCQKHNIVVISDEIYALVGFTSPAGSLATFCPERVIVTSGLSKAFSAGGYRLGFLASYDAAFIKRLATLISETFSCVSAPIQYAALSAYENNTSVMEYVQNCSEIHGIVVNYVAKRFRQMSLNCLDAGGGFYLFPDFKPYQKQLNNRGIFSSEQLCRRLLDEISVAFLPGEDFGFVADGLAVRAAMVDYDGAQVYQCFCENKTAFINQLTTHIPSIDAGLTRLAQWLAK